MAQQPAALQARNLHKRFGNLEALRGIDVSAQAGDAISPIGSSGSGKSTLLRCINLLEHPHEGQIFFDGRTMLIVTHEMRFARDVSSQVIFLHEG